MIYDYKSDEIVQDCITDDLSPIIEDIETEFTKLRRCESIGVHAPASIAKEILSNLLEDIDETFIEETPNIELLLNDKNDVFITIWNDGELFIEKSRSENSNHLVSCWAVMNYIYDSFKKSEIDEFAKDESPVLVFGLKEEPIEKSDCKCTCKCKSDCKEYSGTDEDGNDFHIVIKGDLDLDKAYAKLDEMETRMLHMNEMFDEMKNFSKLLGFRI